MTISMYQASVPVFIQFLNALSAVLDKAAEKGYSLYQPSADLVAAIDAYSKADPAEVVKQATERGVKNAQALVDNYTKTVEKWTKIVAQVGDDRKAFEDALRREIYSKVKVD